MRHRLSLVLALLAAALPTAGWATPSDATSQSVLRGSPQEDMWLVLEARHQACRSLLTAAVGPGGLGRLWETYLPCMADRNQSHPPFTPPEGWHDAVLAAIGLRDSAPVPAGSSLPPITRSAQAMRNRLFEQCLSGETLAGLAALQWVGYREMEHLGSRRSGADYARCREQPSRLFRVVALGCLDTPPAVCQRSPALAYLAALMRARARVER